MLFKAKFANALLAIVALLFASTPNIGEAQDDLKFKTPLPNTIRIVRPGSDVPKEVVAFSGIWVGVWKGAYGSRDGGIVVERVTPTTATIIYSWGVNARNIDSTDGFRRFQAAVEGNILRATFSNGTKVSYALRDDGKLEATYQAPGYAISYSTLTKLPSETAE